jgi:hypothetical protein
MNSDYKTGYAASANNGCYNAGNREQARGAAAAESDRQRREWHEQMLAESERSIRAKSSGRPSGGK